MPDIKLPQCIQAQNLPRDCKRSTRMKAELCADARLKEFEPHFDIS